MVVNLDFKDARQRLTEWNFEHGLGMAETSRNDDGISWQVGNSYVFLLAEGNKSNVILGEVYQEHPANDIAIRAWDNLKSLLAPFADDGAIYTAEALAVAHRAENPDRGKLKDDICKYWRQGFNYLQISQKTTIPYSTVRAYRDELISEGKLPREARRQRAKPNLDSI